MAIWLFIGIVFAAVLLLALVALWTDHNRTTSTLGDQSADATEQRRRADVVAADAARTADARLPPHQGGGLSF
ncbi:MAG TPA: hypothetical protein PK264_08220 [Hyphomicrobiaceae bacterium]|nr:hypothetical protein [Hyphomicrobiaceae bacterium]